MKKASHKTIRNDIILVLSLLLIASIGLFYLFVLRDTGDTVKVTIGGENYGTYSLSKDIAKDIISGKNNEHHNLLIIKNGKVYIKSASCPDGLCVKHKPIFRDGESIVCLPNQVVVTISQNPKDNIVDAIA